MADERNKLRGTSGPLRVAVIGLGTVGTTIARHLLDSGVTLTVCDPRPEMGDEFVARGAQRATSCAAAVRSVDVVIEAVGDDAQVLSTVTAPDGLLATLRPGTVLVLHSTVRLNTARHIAAAAAAGGVHVLDAGISMLGIQASGSADGFESEEVQDLDLVRPVQSLYARCAEHLGRLVGGTTTDLIRDLLGYLSTAATYESWALAKAAGVDLTDIEGAIVLPDDLVDEVAFRVGVDRDPRRLARQFLLSPPALRSCDV